MSIAARLAFAATTALGLLVAGTSTTAAKPISPLPASSFRPAAGWWTLTTGPAGGQLAPQTWAATNRGTDQLPLFNLFVGLKRLTSHGIVIWTINEGRGGPTTAFTKSAWPLRLSSFRVDHSWEGQPAANVQQRLRWADVRGWHLDVRVYFGTQRPSEETLAKAQAEVNRILLPGQH